MRYIFSFLISIFSLAALCQSGTLTIHGRVEDGSTKLDEVDIEIIKDNQYEDEFQNNANGSYKLRLELGSIYNVTFRKEGYVSKTIGVIAKTPDSLITGQYFFQLDINIFELEEGQDSETVFPDVAQLILKGEKAGFVYDKTYVRWISSEYKLKKEDK